MFDDKTYCRNLHGPIFSILSFCRFVLLNAVNINIKTDFLFFFWYLYTIQMKLFEELAKKHFFSFLFLLREWNLSSKMWTANQFNSNNKRERKKAEKYVGNRTDECGQLWPFFLFSLQPLTLSFSFFLSLYLSNFLCSISSKTPFSTFGCLPHNHLCERTRTRVPCTYSFK